MSLMVALIASVALQGIVPSGGVPIVAPDALALQGDAQYGKVERVAIQGQPFKTAVRVTTTKTPPNEWQFEVGTDATVAVAKGDVLLAQVYIRAIKGQPETGEGRSMLDFQVKGGDWSKSVSYGMAATKAWRRFDIPFVAGYDTTAGGANVAFRLGYGPQVVEIGGLSILNFGRRVALESLPKTEIHYRGEEPDAPWRKAALARIEKMRKGPLVIHVIDAKGRPVVGATVRANMTRHAFAFGTAVAADGLFVQGADGDRYRKELIENFNRATIENHLKWPMWEGQSNRYYGTRAAEWIKGHGLTLRAHNVVWPSWRNSPDGLRDLSPAALRKRVDDHIDEVVTSLKGWADLWDVVNEPFDNHDILDRLSPGDRVGLMAEWFQRARRNDPKARLVLNDYPPLDGAATSNAHLNDFYKNLAALKASGAPLGGIGFQAHVGGEAVPPERVLSGLDRFAKLGLPIEITEFDINTQDREFQARYMRDFLIAAFSHPSVSGFTQWGFWSGRHWLPDAALFGPDWSLRPHGKVYLDLVKKAWWTQAQGRTGKDGTYRTRGFYGDYDVTVNGKGTRHAHLAPGSGLLTIRA